jgi:hypothetical protein
MNFRISLPYAARLILRRQRNVCTKVTVLRTTQILLLGMAPESLGLLCMTEQKSY